MIVEEHVDVHTSELEFKTSSKHFVVAQSTIETDLIDQ